MNKYVNAFYEASEIFEDDLDVLALAFVQVREKKDKRRPKNIKELTQDCNFRLLHSYAKRICEMNHKELELLKEKINTKNEL